jgi:hypothetical protein
MQSMFMQITVRVSLIIFILGCLVACGGGSSSVPQAVTPVTAAPVTAAPVTAAPVTAAPVTPVPVTPAVEPPFVDTVVVNYILDEFFPNKTFSGMRSLIKPANTANPLATSMIDCTILVDEASLCSFNQLPLLGMTSSAPTIDEVMDRVLVSHDWMAVRMREVLALMPPEVLLVMRGMTAIVISYDIRPSFYWQGTGAIYIDPGRLWLTQAEELTIDTAPDFRQDLGNVFKFLIPARYVVTDDIDLRSLPRNLDSVSLRMAALLFHELGHANDFYPPTQVDQIDRSVPMYRAVLTGSRPSTLLHGSFPLTSTVMHRLARVSFGSETVRAADQLLTATEVADIFPLDVASDFYSYSSQREDFAMLFEETMMYYSFGIARDVAVTNLPEVLESCSQLLVEWGERHRIAQPAISPRAQFTVEAVLPEIAPAVVATLAALTPKPMLVGQDYCTNIFQAPSASRALRQPGSERQALLPPHFLPYL